jgi:F-type H+-transporting ATPase subunit c
MLFAFPFTSVTTPHPKEGGFMSKKALLVVVGLLLLSLAAPALANEPEAAAASAMGTQKAAQFLAAAIVLGLAAFAGAFGQARAIAAACTSMGRNPGAAGPVRITMIIGVAFIESLVIYALLIAFIILGK